MNEHPPRVRQRKQLRMPCFDYSSDGAYFVTICAHKRMNLFGRISVVGADPCVRPSAAGKMLEEMLFRIESKYKGVFVDYYCVMPNHIHFILIREGGHAGPPLQQIMQWYKTQTTNAYIHLVRRGAVRPFDKKVWQRTYYEHVVRNEDELNEIRKYIIDNPMQWIYDKYYKEDNW